jgi:hypothetical protein
MDVLRMLIVDHTDWRRGVPPVLGPRWSWEPRPWDEEGFPLSVAGDVLVVQDVFEWPGGGRPDYGGEAPKQGYRFRGVDGYTHVWLHKNNFMAKEWAQRVLAAAHRPKLVVHSGEGVEREDLERWGVGRDVQSVEVGSDVAANLRLIEGYLECQG